jgi:drug/metabolite transporter (DMT)-like permease
LYAAPSDRRRGVALAVVTAVISGVAVYANSFGVAAWKEFGGAAPYTTVKNLVAALLLVALLGLAPRAQQTPSGRTPSLRHRLGLVAIAVVGGSIPFLLFFEGLAISSAPAQAALIHKTLVVWVALLAVPLLRERIGWGQIAAIAMLVVGQVALAGGTEGLSLGRGEALVLVATLLWAGETVVAKPLLAVWGSRTLGVARMAGGAAILLALGPMTGAVPWSDLSALAVWWALGTGVLLAGYVATWYAALALAPAVDVTAILVGGAVITAVLAGATSVMLPGLLLVAGGVTWVMIEALRRTPAPVAP